LPAESFEKFPQESFSSSKAFHHNVLFMMNSRDGNLNAQINFECQKEQKQTDRNFECQRSSATRKFRYNLFFWCSAFASVRPASVERKIQTPKKKAQK
jgi:hypothetical protein